MSKLILSVVGLSAIGAGVWAISHFLHESPGGPPLPGTIADTSVVSPAPSASPQDIKLPTTRPAQPAAVVATAQQPSFLYVKYLPDPNSPPETEPAPANDFGLAHRFPPARLRVSTRADDPGTVLLFSDDPKEAINKDWAGDRYYFSMNIPQLGPDQPLDGRDWYCTASLSDKEETGNGIFLHGDQYHLEPVQARVHFDGQAPNLIVKIAGEFLQYDTANPNAPRRRCQVTGMLAPRVDSK